MPAYRSDPAASPVNLEFSTKYAVFPLSFRTISAEPRHIAGAWPA